jgi:hypothetical protein
MNDLDPRQRFSDSDIAASDYDAEKALRAAHEEVRRRRQKKLLHTQHDRDDWRSAHRELATMLGAVDRGRDHCDALLVIAAIKRAFRVSAITVTPDASEVHITTEDGHVHRLLTLQEENT